MGAFGLEVQAGIARLIVSGQGPWQRAWLKGLRMLSICMDGTRARNRVRSLPSRHLGYRQCWLLGAVAVVCKVIRCEVLHELVELLHLVLFLFLLHALEIGVGGGG